MKPLTVLLVACVLVALVHWHGASGFSGRRRTTTSSRRRTTVLVPSTSRRRTTIVSSGRRRSSLSSRVVRTGVRLVGSRLLSSGRRRRSRRSSNRRLFNQQCQQCTPGYVAFDPVTNKYRLQTYGSISEEAQLMRICRSGSVACNSGRCSINYLYSNGTITDFPDNIGGVDPYVGRISSTLESVLICGTLRHAASLQVTLLVLAAGAAAVWMVHRD
ncbi:uncharacterized protein LOC118421646 [Branchiostoma floridae]|uniref:Uncharacterized protein LOC118421646 n=1 Tax=Branchiostoma floridae TaxID=7739 RepID=C3Y2S6_BRAFL|nr:uncharacterized protein LOC118421646 [Branchiostoma floridae]XP_035684953.1 uncharacterized protein LOC118421646 [Branchiostoma floridae]XP_035684954.1 uncharacterized protein LOC118421646 [Branchiostoma floridae]XP_035684955.1 uncharacterized protein LOC118421646 [Branchiostoma floridae]|eukprot:XP_002609328.1 hypothetical protein BRAFLDRAFT_130534 [Branchiostoma floridae]